MVAITRMMVESVRPRSGPAMRGLTAVVGRHAAGTSHPRAVGLVAVEVLWGADMIAFETFTPVRLEAVLDDAEAAAALLGPTNALAWLAAAGAAAVAPALARRAGPPLAGAAMRVAQGITVAGIALFAGAAGIVVAYVATMAVHGAANPVHQGLLHRAVTDPHHRATVVSANSLAGHMGAALGGITLGVLADATSPAVGVLTGAVLLMVAAPLYLVAGQSPTPVGDRFDDQRAAAGRPGLSTRRA